MDMVDMLDMQDRVDMVDMVNMVNIVDMVNMVNMEDMVNMVEIIFTCGCWPRTAQLRWGRAVLRQTNQSALFPSITSGVKEADRQITFIPIHPSSNFEFYSHS